MKTIILSIAISLITFLGYSQNALTVKITNLKTNSGTVYVKVLDKNQKELKSEKSTVKDGTCQVIFTKLPSATYAVTYYHDENNNGKLDAGMFGKPEEGYGYSNDARGFMGPADFEDQIFELKTNQTITLKTVQ